MRYRKRKKAASQVMEMTVVVLAVLATLMVLTCSQVFKVRSVLVVGNRNISKEDIIALSGVREGDQPVFAERRRVEKEAGTELVHRVYRP